MSRLSELKKQYPQFNITLLDIFALIDPTESNKYLPLFCKLFKNSLGYDSYQLDNIEKERVIREVIHDLTEIGVPIEKIDYNVIRFLHDNIRFLDTSKFETILEFISHVENNRIENNDVTTYNTIEQLQLQISLAELKLNKKTLQNQIRTEFEDETWLVLRPLSFESSLKYGAGTKWCTTMKSKKSYFYRYWKNGILVYFINKITGCKFAGYKCINGIEHEFSFWNSIDERVDTISFNLDPFMYEKIREIFNSTNTNEYFCTETERNNVYKECNLVLSDEEEGDHLYQGILPDSFRFIPNEISSENLNYLGSTLTNITQLQNYSTTTNPSLFLNNSVDLIDEFDE